MHLCNVSIALNDTKVNFKRWEEKHKGTRIMNKDVIDILNNM